jgi:hypothetical protein
MRFYLWLLGHSFANIVFGIALYILMSWINLWFVSLMFDYGFGYFMQYNGILILLVTVLAIVRFDGMTKFKITRPDESVHTTSES